MKRKDAIPYISFCLDDALSERDIKDMPANARLIGWQCGFEPLFVAVWSYLDVRLDDDDAEEIARDFLRERKWFVNNDETNEADYVI
jgi:hypothetical protein